MKKWYSASFQYAVISYQTRGFKEVGINSPFFPVKCVYSYSRGFFRIFEVRSKRKILRERNFESRQKNIYQEFLHNFFTSYFTSSIKSSNFMNTMESIFEFMKMYVYV